MLNADALATELTNGGSGWMVLSVAAILPILWAFAFVSASTSFVTGTP